MISLIRNTEKWSILALARFALSSIVAMNHLEAYCSLGILSIVPMLGAFEAILGFLLISGFSVTSSFQKRPVGFFTRRIKRLYPVYIASMAIMLAVSMFVGDPLPGFVTLVLNALFLNQLFTSSSFVGPAWSLSLEVWLYLLLPLFAKASPRFLRRLSFLSFACFILYTGMRPFFKLDYFAGVGFGGNLLLLSFMWICGLRLIVDDQRKQVTHRDINLFFIGHISFATLLQFCYRLKHDALWTYVQQDLPAFAMRSLTLVLLVLIFRKVTSSPNEKSRKENRVFMLLGDISYPLYLIHIPVYMALSKLDFDRQIWPIAYFCSAIAVSFIVYWFVDSYSQKRGHVVNSEPKARLC